MTAQGPATHGPVPKRSSEAAGHQTRAERPDKVVMQGPVKPPPARGAWAPLARAWYNALKLSGQSKWYEPSDWQAARVCAELLSWELLRDGGPRAAQMHVVFSAMASLGTTEGDRRRLRIEVERQSEAPEQEAEREAMAQVTRLATRG